MNIDLIISNIVSPPVLFFFLGAFSVLVKSDLEIPAPLPKFFSLYLLMNLGFHGGHELHESGFSPEIVHVLGACIVMASLTPIYCFFILKRHFGPEDAAAIAATFGSVSAVTFISAQSFLGEQAVLSSGYMVAGMAFMESPAIILGVLLYNIFRKDKDENADYGNRKTNWGHLLNDAFFNGSVLLLVGALVVGYMSGDKGWHDMVGFDAIFKGMLSFYLLESGIIAAKRIRSIKGHATFMLVFSILMPLLNAMIGILVSKYILDIKIGNALLFTVLCASASYIAVPAAIRLAIPRSNPAFTVPIALGVVFPFNVIVGIPVYFFIIQQLWEQ
jgi:uncharacterized protein